MNEDLDPEDIPGLIQALVVGAFQEAYNQALESGLPIIYANKENLVKRFPDGSEIILKQLPQRVRIKE